MDDASPYLYAMNRLLDTIIGVIVALVVNLTMPGAAPIKPVEAAAQPGPAEDGAPKG